MFFHISFQFLVLFKCNNNRKTSVVDNCLKHLLESNCVFVVLFIVAVWFPVVVYQEQW